MNREDRVKPWPCEPQECRCFQLGRFAVADLAGTLGCPAGWRPLPGGRWAHDLWGPR